MALNILPREIGWGEALGSGLGAGLSSGVDSILEGLKEQKARKLQAKGFQEAYNLPPDKAAAIAQMPPNVQQEFIKQLMGKGVLASEASQQEFQKQQAMGQQQPQQSEFQQGLDQEQQGIDQTLQGLAGQQPQQPQQSIYPAGFNQQTATYDQPAQSYDELLARPSEKELQRRMREQRAQQDVAIKQENLEVKKQQAIDKQNEPFIKDIREQIKPAKRVRNIIGDIREILKEPGVNLGSITSFAPSFLQNAPTQRMVSKLNELVSAKLENVKGVPNKLRTALEQAAKPNIWQKPEVVKSLLDTIEKGVSEVLTKDEIKDYFIDNNNGEQPKGLESKVNTLYKQTKHLDEPASDYDAGSIVKDAKGRKFVSNGNIWISV